MADNTGDKSAGRGKATIADVAEAAGVAIGTVSRYLNGFDIRRANRDQIEQAIRQLSYRRNAAAASMKTDRTHIIGLMVPTFDDFHSPMLEHLARSVRPTGRALLTYCHSGEMEMIARGLDFFEEQRVDAIIMDGANPLFGHIDRLIKAGTPIIFYNNDVPGLAADRVFVENYKAGFRAVNYLLDIGHKRIAALTGEMAHSSGRQRLDGYEAALKQRGIAIDPRYIVNGGWFFHGGYTAARRLMTLDEPPTAVYASNYGMTTGFMSWLKEHGFKVPRDVSIVSFDDVPLFRLHEEGITAIAQPIAQIAEAITNLLTARLAAPNDRNHDTVTLDCDLVIRGSTQPPA
ncbi:LacI family DNA-binding transcriptional regulator [Devosia sp.]|uniref:LacI family DNA-binding transcriptional regulator n=1 Tax=Devosia sp. TaxID=1871048 RepID=UPI0032668F15